MQSKLPMKDFVISLLKNTLSKNYYYHNHKHTLYVTEKAIEIGRHEGCTEKELELLAVAALWHDSGYTTIYDNHEEESCLLARQYLPEYGYSPQDIDEVCGMIMATKMPQSPKTKLEEILADADLEYLGTSGFETLADLLFKELQLISLSFTEEKWRLMQISFLQNHRYFTRFCKENRESVKQMNLSKLINQY
jgi:uncharacterized protein